MGVAGNRCGTGIWYHHTQKVKVLVEPILDSDLKLGILNMSPSKAIPRLPHLSDNMPNLLNSDWNDRIKFSKVISRVQKVRDFSSPLPLSPSPPQSDLGMKAVIPDLMLIGARHIPRRNRHRETILPTSEAYAEGATA